jgi:hypothetical protein
MDSLALQLKKAAGGCRGVVANRLHEFSGDLSGLMKLADPQSNYAWGAFIATTKAAIASNKTDTFSLVTGFLSGFASLRI